ncbi:PAQR family membrane homeostasis protein TrhA [Chakrabartyella piscis]|uniref:PAQR family membrane homeostasis protein TrhA n=1 Tax=Chakrabartyella piscis TaxID=2918914 RepID=UPI0029585324|nr:hemolysin III family protein [Chakrabartyella piscis]
MEHIQYRNQTTFMERMERNVKDPMSALTHLIGFLAVTPLGLVLIDRAVTKGDTLEAVALLVFTISIMLSYASSTIYHTLQVSKEKELKLRKIDHMMIFVLISGTYTPICLGPIGGWTGLSMVITVWSMTIAGVFVKLFWMNAPRWFSTSLYVVMGWLSATLLAPLYHATGIGGVVCLIGGGIAYTIGAVIYALKKPAIASKYFGFHEIFHLFVMLGSAFHIAFMFLYV